MFPRTKLADRTYALQEMTALFLSWLAAMPCAVFNRPHPQGLSGAWFHPSEWAIMAARANLPVLPFHQTSAGDPLPNTRVFGDAVPAATVLVVCGRAVGTKVPEDIATGCVALARLADLALASFEFTSEWMLTRASPHPDLRLGGEALLDALARALSEAAE
jgi:hypothetical protein